MVRPRKSDGFKWSLKSSRGGAELAAAAVPDKFLPGSPPREPGGLALPRSLIIRSLIMQPALAPGTDSPKNVFFSAWQRKKKSLDFQGARKRDGDRGLYRWRGDWENLGKGGNLARDQCYVSYYITSLL